MPFDHEKLDVYTVALELLVLAGRQARYYLSASGSATECAAILDVIAPLHERGASVRATAPRNERRP